MKPHRLLKLPGPLPVAYFLQHPKLVKAWSDLPPCISLTTFPNVSHRDFFANGMTSNQLDSMHTLPFLGAPLFQKTNKTRICRRPFVGPVWRSRYVRKYLHCGRVRRERTSKTYQSAPREVLPSPIKRSGI